MGRAQGKKKKKDSDSKDADLQAGAPSPSQPADVLGKSRQSRVNPTKVRQAPAASSERPPSHGPSSLGASQSFSTDGLARLRLSTPASPSPADSVAGAAASPPRPPADRDSGGTVLDEDTLLAVFARLRDAALLCRCACVCRRWRFHTSDEELWRALFLQRFGAAGILALDLELAGSGTGRRGGDNGRLASLGASGAAGGQEHDSYASFGKDRESCRGVYVRAQTTEVLAWGNGMVWGEEEYQVGFLEMVRWSCVRAFSCHPTPCSLHP